MDNPKPTSNSNKRAVLYMRVANAAQKDVAISQFDMQRARCQAVANEHGFSVVEEYRESGSGVASLEKRTALQQLLDDLAERRVDYVITSDLARLSRNARDLMAIEQRLTQANAGLLVCGQGPNQVEVRRRLVALVADEWRIEHAALTRRGIQQARSQRGVAENA